LLAGAVHEQSAFGFANFDRGRLVAHVLRAGEFPPGEARLGRRALICCTVLAVVFGALSIGATPAIAAKQPTPPAASKKPVIPSQSQIDTANADAQAKATQIGQTEAQLAAANASLQSLNDHVEMLVEAYDHATADVDAAQQGVESATQDLANATRDRLDAQVQMSVFAANSYRGGGSLDRMSALMTADSPALFMTRASTLTALARHEQSVIARLQTTEEQQTAAQAAANAALTNRIGAAAVASKAKDQAIDAVNSQALGIAQINAQQQDLQAQLAVLQGTAKDLATARAQGLKRLAEEAAAAAAAAAAARAAALAAAARARAEAARQAALEAARKATHGASGNNSGGNNSGSNGNSSSGGGIVPGGGHSVSTASQRQRAIAFAQSQVGIWYRWAGTGDTGPTVTSSGIQNLPGYDCSGLTMKAYQAAGISLSHYTGAQWDQGIHVAQSQVQPGDLLFFATNTNDPNTIHHVGIYIGNGQMIDAPQTGEQVGVHNAFRSDYIGAVEL